MSLADALSANNIKSALIVDDVCDVIPTAADLGTAIDDWSNFNADLRQSTVPVLPKNALRSLKCASMSRATMINM